MSERRTLLYAPPRLTVVEFRSERGYAISLDIQAQVLMLELQLETEASTHTQVEAYQYGGPSSDHWDFDNNSFWL